MAILKLYVYNRHNCHNRHLITKKENLIMAMQRYKFIKNTIGNDQRHKAFSTRFNGPIVFGRAGTGKSFFQKEYILRKAGFVGNAVPDYTDEYEGLSKSLEGVVIESKFAKTHD